MSMRHRVSVLILLPLLLIGATACRDGTIFDDWGPPAGYGAVAGVIRDSSGTSAPNILVAVSICESPIAGFLGEAASDGQGRYRIDGRLAPVGLVPSSFNADTLRVKCELFVGPRGAAVVRDTVTVPFSRSPGGVHPAQRDVTLP